MIRDDLSNRLIHLAKGTYKEGHKTFQSILNDGKLLGSSNMIRGKDKVICFTEAPINKIAQIIASTNIDNMRYRPFGVMFEKDYLFEKGARPVIYQTEEEYKLLKQEQKYRHVRFEPHNDIDWTWEHEWRLNSKELVLEPEHVTLIVPYRSIEEALKNEHQGAVNRAGMVTMFGASIVGKFRWHCLVLEDLGVKIPKP